MKIKRYITFAIFLSFPTLLIFSGKAFSWDIIDIISKKCPDDRIIDAKSGSNETDFYFLPPAQDKSFFESINDLSICRNENVRKFINLYLTNGRKYLITAISRSNQYLKTIHQICNKENDIPEEIALLPLLESAFNPFAVSRSKAVGLWQFIKGTSRTLDLKVNKWVDERRDVEKSTVAALQHLRTLYNTFGSWEPALAAYNGGAAYIKRVMKKRNCSSFYQLAEANAFVRETNEYVYRFAALLVIYKNQKMFDIEEDIVENQLPATEIIKLEYPVKIQRAAELSGVSAETLRMLNPELKQNITPPYEKIYSFKVPKGCKEKLENNITSLYNIKYDRLKKHIVKEGECLSRIASAYKTDVRKIILLNNLKDPGLIKPGLELYIPI